MFIDLLWSPQVCSAPLCSLLFAPCTLVCPVPFGSTLRRLPKLVECRWQALLPSALLCSALLRSALLSLLYSLYPRTTLLCSVLQYSGQLYSALSVLCSAAQVTGSGLTAPMWKRAMQSTPPDVQEASEARRIQKQGVSGRRKSQKMLKPSGDECQQENLGNSLNCGTTLVKVEQGMPSLKKARTKDSQPGENAVCLTTYFPRGPSGKLPPTMCETTPPPRHPGGVSPVSVGSLSSPAAGGVSPAPEVSMPPPAAGGVPPAAGVPGTLPGDAAGAPVALVAPVPPPGGAAVVSSPSTGGEPPVGDMSDVSSTPNSVATTPVQPQVHPKNAALCEQVVREQDKFRKYRTARMRYLRASRNPEWFKIPQHVVELMAQGLDLFSLWSQSDEDWGKVGVSVKQSNTSSDKIWHIHDMKTKAQLLDFYKNDEEVVNAIIQDKMEKKEYMDNPDCPGNLNARLYKVWSGAGRRHEDEHVRESTMQMAGVVGHEGAQPVTALAAATLRPSSHSADLALLSGCKDKGPKPKPVKKAKTETQLAEKDRKDLLRKLGGLCESMSKHSKLLVAMGTQQALADKLLQHKASVETFVSHLEGMPIKGLVTQAGVKQVADDAASVWGGATLQQDVNLAKRLTKPAPKPKTSKLQMGS